MSILNQFKLLKRFSLSDLTTQSVPRNNAINRYEKKIFFR